MKSIKNVLLGLVLSTCAAFASAAPTPIVMDPLWVMADLDAHGGSLQMFRFGEGGDYVKAGDLYVYQFLFNTPPPTAWFGFTLTPDVADTVAFVGAGLTTLQDMETPLGSGSFYGSASQLSGGFILDSGVYDLQVLVSYLADGASFSGIGAADFATVPEPMSLGLVGLGLAGIAGLRRRKGAAKAA